MTDTIVEKPVNNLIGSNLSETLDRVNEQLTLIMCTGDHTFTTASLKNGISSMCANIIAALQYEADIADVRYRR